jgi:hypothetical protein
MNDPKYKFGDTDRLYHRGGGNILSTRTNP